MFLYNVQSGASEEVSQGCFGTRTKLSELFGTSAEMSLRHVGNSSNINITCNIYSLN